MDETQTQRLGRKFEEAPFFPIGIAGLLIACAVGAYKYKTRGAMSTSVYLMQLRVAAQGTVVGCLAIGLTYTMFRDYVLKPHKKEH